MVLFYCSNALGEDKPVVIYAGKDKFENEVLLNYYQEQDVWVHVDKLSSPHIYIRMPEGMNWEKMPEKLLLDAGQIVKAGSIQGNKQAVTIIYTPASNILKRGDFAIGAVSFLSDRKVKRFRIEERVNAIVNRLNKTKVERQVDHEAEKIAYESAQQRLKREIANKQKNADLLLARQRKADAETRSYEKLFTGQSGKADDQWEEDQWEASRKEGDFDPEEDFM
ncbi:coiled-coil domain-containing protein 25 [Rhodotorula toruloides]|uniref:Coiled-coil domain-containing protein 25 n=1 Tax=Rhodotorula toruloides TaxID=5286 RepID=A0A511KIK4_RHOTO|nr:coiled-coil domain-containing protein 25 [Rhodotorula toruloides]